MVPKSPAIFKQNSESGHGRYRDLSPFESRVIASTALCGNCGNPRLYYNFPVS
jgi:hypothetical protein